MRRVFAPALLTALVAAPAIAEAGTISIATTDFVGVDAGYVLVGVVDTPSLFTVGSMFMSGGTGLGPSLDAPATFESYCVDLITSLQTDFGDVGTEFYADASVMSLWSDPSGVRDDGALIPSTEAGQRAAWLYNTYAADIAEAGTDLEARRQRGALQIAIWEVLYDDGVSVTDGAADAGRFYLADERGLSDFDPHGITSIANGYLSALNALPLGTDFGDAAWLQLETLDRSEDSQDLIGPLSTSAPPVGVPEPSSMLLLLAGVAVVAGARGGRGDSAAR